jgi:hypothetical protein
MAIKHIHKIHECLSCGYTFHVCEKRRTFFKWEISTPQEYKCDKCGGNTEQITVKGNMKKYEIKKLQKWKCLSCAHTYFSKFNALLTNPSGKCTMCGEKSKKVKVIDKLCRNQ